MCWGCVRQGAKPAVWLSLLLSAACAALPPTGWEYNFSDSYHSGDRYRQIRLLGALQLPRVKVDGQDLVELSGLAWDEDEQILYAVSDKAILFHLRPQFSDDGILTAVEPLRAFWLRDSEGKPLKGKLADSEGLDIEHGRNGLAGDSELLISFERVPRAMRYRPDGELLGRVALPAPLRWPEKYQGGNKMLEALALHPHLGIIAAPEWPLREADQEKIMVYAADEQFWQFPRLPAPSSAVTGLEVLDEQNLLVLERAFSSPFAPVVIGLRRLDLASGTASDMAIFDSSQGWRVDNFEGLARHQGQRFFMVSDDNGNVLQRTLLVYFELLE
jgi:hypothetical protein